MAKKDPRVDAYIAKSAAFAKPILKHVRKLVHAACPDVEETIKWGFPHFTYKGLLCSMAGFKAHCTFGFWKGSLLTKMHKEFGSSDEEAHGQFGRITSLADLPAEKKLLRFIKDAVALNEEGVKLPTKPKRRTAANRELEVPDYFRQALRKNKRALATFDAFSDSHKKEYVEWIVEAKTEATRDRRIAQALEWMTEGKSRYWKYARK
jgi:uncharacterized protein YdeI (YjbR/CyaY-like superfamily)